MLKFVSIIEFFYIIIRLNKKFSKYVRVLCLCAASVIFLNIKNAIQKQIRILDTINHSFISLFNIITIYGEKH